MKRICKYYKKKLILHIYIYANIVSICVSYGVLRFNTMAKPATVRNWDQVVFPSTHCPFSVGSGGGANRWGTGGKGLGGQHGWEGVSRWGYGRKRNGCGRDEQGRIGWEELDMCIMHWVHTTLI
jgi:hypothetical protein